MYQKKSLCKRGYMIKGMKEGQKRKHHCRGKKQQIIETTARSENAKRIGGIKLDN
jgi:hypothetical protein